ncbi:acyltransferase [Rhizobium sp. P32RR-XVIII]|uniref:acyltransferase family protein n=1 Tax=Rhizobium sp. P32RR-XVIII TaxID=2726738 RepID=UPI001456E551|nr:acyltransferase [Rhizobium sp. P32RR-XVIII]NLS06855.1 acyltransferase [Rhizobium sp. P32RR-XVIII]
MGAFRLLLAVAVFLAHARVNFPGLAAPGSMFTREKLHIMVGSGHAVFAFFIASGFYMAMVIEAKYAGAPKRFYLNRALRIYPANFAILAAYALYFLSSGTASFLTLDTVPGREWMTPIALFSNVFFLGGELVPLFNKADWQFILSPIWSLSVEIYFYLLAPFIVRLSTMRIAGLTLAAFAFRMGLYWSGVPLLPWRYFLFPSDFVFFLMGVLAYRLLGRIDAKPIGIAAATLLFGLVTYEPFWGFKDLDQWQCWMFYILVAACTPLIFNLTKKSAVDNFLGHLSYPIYLGHLFMLSLVARFYNVGPLDKTGVALVLTFALAIAIYTIIDRPIEELRRRVAGARSERASERLGYNLEAAMKKSSIC